MKKNILLLLPLLVGLTFPVLTAAQVKQKPDPTPAAKTTQAVSPTPALTVAPTDDPAAVTPTPSGPTPTKSVPAPTTVEPTNETTPTVLPTATPTPESKVIVPPAGIVSGTPSPGPTSSPTPTPTKKPTPSAIPKPTAKPTDVPVIQKVANSANSVIRAPLDLLSHVVAPDIYATQGISRRNSAFLLFTALLCIGEGVYLLKDSIKGKILRKS